MLRRTLRENIEIRLSAAPVLPCVYADPGQVEQVLMNLAINAQDAMPQGGVLSIQVNAVHLSSVLGSGEAVLAPGAYVVLTVGDTGVGMSQAVLDRLFEPFFTTKEQGRGTGLGLSTVYGIVRQHGGIILVESNQGQGSLFKIYFPVWERPGAAGTGNDESSSLTPAHGTETILIMEDDPMVRKVAGEMLQQLGYTAVLAENPEDCLTLLAKQKQPMHLLLTDVVMPTMDGRELARRAQAVWPGLKVLYMSGYTHEVIDHAGVLEPGIQYIQKPLSLKMLSEKLRSALDTPQGTC
jgi:CheY-like chemotaxis protein